MARTVRDAALETRAARARLRPRGKPYYRNLEEGLHLGYRKPVEGPGKWVVRHYIGGQDYTVETIAAADDLSDPDGVAILSYRQAQAQARERMVHRPSRCRQAPPLTVRDVVEPTLNGWTATEERRRRAPSSQGAYLPDASGIPKRRLLTTDALPQLARRPRQGSARERAPSPARRSNTAYSTAARTACGGGAQARTAC